MTALRIGVRDKAMSAFKRIKFQSLTAHAPLQDSVATLRYIDAWRYPTGISPMYADSIRMHKMMPHDYNRNAAYPYGMRLRKFRRER